MFLEVLVLVCLLLKLFGVRNFVIVSMFVIFYNVKENCVYRVVGNLGLYCGFDLNLFYGSSECFIVCLIKLNYLYGFGWNKNLLECCCC